jgi:amino acid adenylation domain-containing protein
MEKVYERAGRIPRRIQSGPPPLSFAQQRLWLIDQLEPGAPTYNVSRAARLTGPLKKAALQRSLDEIVRRHEALRTSFPSLEGSPIQLIAPTLTIPLPITDLTGVPEVHLEAQSRRLLTEMANRPFDLARGSLLRADLLQLGPEEHILLLVMHHIASDGWSMAILFRELEACYDAFATGRPAALPDLPIQYADYAVWQHERIGGGLGARELAYWREQLRGAPALLELPIAGPRPAIRKYRGAKQSMLLPRGLVDELHALGRLEGATLFMTVLAAFQSLLARYTGQDDIVVGTPIAGRRLETESLIGFFVNSLALRTDLSGDPTFRALLRRVREVALAAYDHQELPFQKLVEELQPARTLSHEPLFQVVIAMQNVPGSALELAGLRLHPVTFDSGIAKFDLTLDVREETQGLGLTMEYSTDLFETAAITRLLGHFRTLLDGVVTNPDRRLSELPLLTELERYQCLVEWNGTATDYPREATIEKLFEAQAAGTPDAPAVTFEAERLTYGELNEQADRLAHYLRARGVRPEVRVGICLERSLQLVVGVLGVLKAGGVYVPLDPSHPQERLRFLLADAQVGVLVTERRQLERLPPGEVGTVVCLDSERAAIALAPQGPLQSGALAEHLAYVMYTSGSTGQPKGVAVPHRAVVRLVRDTNYFQAGPDEVFLQLAPMAFDASTFELWGALLTGSHLVIAPAGTLSLEEIGRIVRQHGVTTLWLTAGLFHLMVDQCLDDLRGVRQLLVGGDVLSVAHVKRVLREVPGCRVLNGYGPTESTTFACCYPITPEGLEGSVPIGRPIANTTAYVLDRQMNLVPVGVPGELYLGGAGLARGYLGRPGLTAERFVPGPAAIASGDGPGYRLYRTGDRVRWRANGTLEFLGRLDQQVKVRGYRVEPGEIEMMLCEHPAVQGAAVIATEDTSGDRCLVAYVVPKGTTLPVSDLRSFLQQRLPDYMVPSLFMLLEALPLSSNGKVDRAALPAPDQLSQGQDTWVAPRNRLEEQLAAIWAAVLRLERVGVEDNFFALGGHSLLATQVISRVRTSFGVELPVRALFEDPTVTGLARRVSLVLETTAVPAPPLVRLPREADARSRLSLHHSESNEP